MHELMLPIKHVSILTMDGNDHVRITVDTKLHGADSERENVLQAEAASGKGGNLLRALGWLGNIEYMVHSIEARDALKVSSGDTVTVLLDSGPVKYQYSQNEFKVAEG